jgi:3'-phosphoadenosine 5'-phosphosulfate (PAPS) 3'-phosphatase
MDKIELENKIHNKPVTMTFISKSGKFCVRNGIAEISEHPNTIIIKNPVTEKYASACVENIFAIRGKESKENFYLYTDHGVLEERKLKSIKEIVQEATSIDDTLKTLMKELNGDFLVKNPFGEK